MKRKSVYTLLTASALTLIPSTAFAGEGDATAVDIDGVLTISDCSASDGKASCTGLAILGNEVSGTSQEGDGEAEDSMGCTTALGIPEDQVEGCLFRNRSKVSGGSSESESDGAYLNVGDGTVEVSVLRARANNNGDAESDGVYVNVAGTEVHVLHAQSTGGEGEAAVAVIGGNGIITDDDTGGVFCPADVSPVVIADIICASGAQAGVVANADVLGTITGNIVTVNTGTGGEAVPTPAPEPEPIPAPDPFPPITRTGFDLWSLLLSGGAALASGEGMRRRGAIATIA